MIMNNLINNRSRLILMVLFMPIVLGLMPLKAQTGETVNLGLYGGAAVDLSYCNTNSRLFSAVNTPASVFYTDDNCDTWVHPFPLDSLEYHSNQRGWGGGAKRVLANANGWVAVHTIQQGGTLSAAVISFSEGDSGTFRTAIDNYMLRQIDPSYLTNAAVTAIGLSDHYLFVGMNKYLIRMDETQPLNAMNVIAQTDTIPGIGSDYNILAIAAANSPTGFPLYLVIGAGGSGGELYRFDETGFTKINVAVLPDLVEDIFTHPAQVTGDTLFASVKMLVFAQERKVFRSVDGGANWTDVTPSYGTNWPLHSSDYSANWVATMPTSNGLRISFPGGGVSDDLGDTWSNHVLPDNAMATLPTDPDFVVGSYGRGVATSPTGPNGTFTIADNEGMAAVSISKISRYNGIFYVGTNAGLGYTNSYFSTTVVGVDRWKAPYGQFAIPNVGGDGSVTAVAISPTDSLHVIAGHGGGFSVSTTGHTGFTNVVPTGWNTSTNYDAGVRDIKFINDQLVLAITGAGSNFLQYPTSPYGNIYRSEDGGYTWSQVTPAGFEQGTCMVVGKANEDTVVYAGAGYWDHNFDKVDGQLWKSIDKGLSWTQINTGPTGVGAGTTDMPIYDIDIDPRSNDTLYIASGQNLDYALVRSTDGGLSYNYVSSFVPHGAFSSVLVHAINPDIVTTGARRNLFRWNTFTGGITITFNGLPGEFVPDLENGSTILGTNTGLYKLVENFGETFSIWNGTGSWDMSGNWTSGVPGYLMDAKIASGVVEIDGGAEVNKIKIAPGSGVSLTATAALTLNDSITIFSNASGTGSFVDESGKNRNYLANISNYLVSGRWHYVSSPVIGALSSSLYFEGGSQSWLKVFQEASNTWQYIEALDMPLEPGVGYAVWVSTAKSDETANFKGPLAYGDLDLVLSFTDASHGWNLLGNPFPSALDWDLGAWNRTNTTGIAYVWNNGSYLTRNLIGAGTLTDGIIPLGQGFFVQASAAAAFTIPADARVHSALPYYKSSEETANMLNVRVSSNGRSDQLTIGFYPTATSQYDLGLDAIRLNGDEDMPKLYTLIDEKPMAINIQAALIDSVAIPLWFGAPQEGEYTLDFGGLESFEATTVKVKDLMLGQTQTLVNGGSYVFNSLKTDPSKRFELVFKHSGTGIEPIVSNEPKVYQNGKNLMLVWDQEPATNQAVKIYTVSGQLLGIWDLSPNKLQTIDLSTISSQMVLVSIATDKYVYNKKVFIQK